MSDDKRDYEERQKRHALHQGNLGNARGDSNAPETLQYVSQPEDIDSPVESLEWINSKSTSTANLTSDDVMSKKWKLEYSREIATTPYPPAYGIKGHLRAYMYDDKSEYRMPLDTDKKVETEGFMEVGKESNTRSKDGWGVETATKDTQESIVRNDEDKSGGSGILGRFK